MKLHFHFFALGLLLLLQVCEVLSQDKIIFQRVPPPSGLHPGTKVGMQDSQGYIWIGTYQAPLRRYDGYHYTFYSNDPLDSNSLAENWVEALCAGRNGIIWMGTADRGLDQLDPATRNFKHYRHNPKDSNSLSSDSVGAILEDHEGVLTEQKNRKPAGAVKRTFTHKP